MKALLNFSFIFLLSSYSLAAGGGGGHSLGVNLGFGTPSQDDTNLLISRANTREGSISTSQLGTAYEFAPFYMYRFSSTMFAFQFRPSYFYQKRGGSGASGDFNYGYTGFTVFPMLRMYPLENNFIKFFLHTGLGYGSLTGEITEGSFQVSYKGDAFGFMAGLGAEFCFTANHCMNLEGTYRYLPINRNLASTVSGTPGSGSVSQAEVGKEVEVDQNDLSSTLSGFQGIIGYIMRF